MRKLNGLTAIGTVQQYLPPDGDDGALFHIVHDDGDSEDHNIDRPSLGYQIASTNYNKKSCC